MAEALPVLTAKYSGVPYAVQLINGRAGGEQALQKAKAASIDCVCGPMKRCAK